MARSRLCTLYVVLVLSFVGYGCSEDTTSPPPGNTGGTPLAHRWSQGFGDAGDQLNIHAAVDGSGNVITTGSFKGAVNFGGGDLTSAGDNDIFVAKFDATGNHVWSKRFGDALIQFATGAVDGSGNVIVTGSFQGSVDFGGGVLTSAGSHDIYIAKFDPAGNHVWSRRFGGTDIDFENSVAVDGSGNVIVTGTFRASIDFGGGVLTAAGIADDIYVAKFDATGNHVWSKRFGDATAESAYGVAADGSGNVIVTGPFESTVNFGGGVLTSAGGESDIYVAKFDGTGNHLWSKRFGDADGQSGYGVAVDGSNNVIATGDFYSSVDFGGGVLTSAGDRDAYIAKFDASGNHVWSKRFGNASSDDIYGGAVDGSGNVIVTGTFYDSVDFGGGALTSAGDGDIYLATFNPSGNYILSKRFGDADDQWGNSVAVDGSGNVIMAGAFAGSVNFGGGVRTSGGGYDLFLAKFAR